MRPHEKLDVWNQVVDLAVAVYKATENFPRDERFGLTVTSATSGRLGAF